MAITEFVVISGKGGTGKTTVTASLAAFIGKAVLTDADVDGANLELALQANLVHEESIVGGKKALIKPTLCTACGRCADLCRFGAVIPGANHASGGIIMAIDTDLCEGCGLCIRMCPSKAITFRESKGGSWRHSKTRWGDLFHARLVPGGENSGKLVALLRRKARELASEQGTDFMLTDGPPGAGCPVIATLTGAHRVLVVTEPTPSGMSDAERVINLCRHFRRTVAIAINKFDLHSGMTSKIEAWAQSSSIPIVGHLPYDPVVPKAIRQGIPVLALPPSAWSKALIAMAQRLELPSA
ncbi:MAG: ATP-binding protein [Candidatus Ozemobacteraceae bacterium]